MKQRLSPSCGQTLYILSYPLILVSLQSSSRSFPAVFDWSSHSSLSSSLITPFWFSRCTPPWILPTSLWYHLRHPSPTPGIGCLLPAKIPLWNKDLDTSWCQRLSSSSSSSLCCIESFQSPRRCCYRMSPVFLRSRSFFQVYWGLVTFSHLSLFSPILALRSPITISTSCLGVVSTSGCSCSYNYSLYSSSASLVGVYTWMSEFCTARVEECTHNSLVECVPLLYDAPFLLPSTRYSHLLLFSVLQRQSCPKSSSWMVTSAVLPICLSIRTLQHPRLKVALGVRREAPGDLIRLRGSLRLCPTSFVTPVFQLRKLSLGSSHVARRYSWMSSSIVFLVSVIKYFYGAGISGTPNPQNWRASNYHLVWLLPFDLPVKVRPPGEAPDSIALRVIEACKLPPLRQGGR